MGTLTTGPAVLVDKFQSHGLPDAGVVHLVLPFRHCPVSATDPPQHC